jgi:hypothetical protein
MHDFFICEPRFEARANSVAQKACSKLVKDMHYEARIQAITTYSAQVLGVKINKTQPRNTWLTQELYLQVNKEH